MGFIHVLRNSLRCWVRMIKEKKMRFWNEMNGGDIYLCRNVCIVCMGWVDFGRSVVVLGRYLLWENICSQQNYGVVLSKRERKRDHPWLQINSKIYKPWKPGRGLNDPKMNEWMAQNTAFCHILECKTRNIFDYFFLWLVRNNCIFSI